LYKQIETERYIEKEPVPHSPTIQSSQVLPTDEHNPPTDRATNEVIQHTLSSASNDMPPHCVTSSLLCDVIRPEAEISTAKVASCIMGRPVGGRATSRQIAVTTDFIFVKEECLV